MTLSDGSKVWLNAGSSVRFPVAFTGNERKVSITGEAYFEVAHDARKPFIVKDINRNAEVQVFGTHFNVNAYDDEPTINVTLLEGSVKVNNTMIKPGQQAQVGNGVKVASNVDFDEVMAWKNGRFQFEGAGIEEVMRQVARWYDVEVIYENKPLNQHFRGGISREVEASKLFKMLEMTEAVHFRIEGKKVYVIK
jgi:ferric-dicitrate binding protein FerR (iron transport regulator)